jgi:hypothetical protein
VLCFMPNRMLKDWTASARVDLLTPEAEVFFVRLIMKADDHGCFHGNPKLLNSLLFPLKEHSFADVLKWRNECQKAGMINVYVSDRQNYIQIVDFGQRLRTMKSKFPQPADNCPQPADNGRPELEEKRNEENTNMNKYVSEVSKYFSITYNKRYDRDQGGPTGQDIDDLVKEFLKFNAPKTFMEQIRCHKLYIGLNEQKPPTKMETIRTALMENDWVQKLKDLQDTEKLANGLNNEQARRATRIAAGSDLPPANLGNLDN